MPRLGLKKLRELVGYESLARDGKGVRWVACPSMTVGMNRPELRRVARAIRRGNTLLTRTPSPKATRSTPPVTCYPNDVGNYRGKRKASDPTLATARRVYSSPSDIDGFGAMAAIAMMAAKIRRRTATV